MIYLATLTHGMNIYSMFLWHSSFNVPSNPKWLWMQTLSFCKIKNYCCVFNSLVLRGEQWRSEYLHAWFSVSATHNIEDLMHQKVYKQHPNVTESFTHNGNYLIPCFILSLSFLIWIQVEYFFWMKGMCQCTTQGYFHPLWLIQSYFP